MESIDRSVEFKTNRIEFKFVFEFHWMRSEQLSNVSFFASLRYSNIVTHSYAVPSLFSNRQWPACLPNGMWEGVVNIGESVRFDLVRPFERLSLLAQTFDWISNCCAARNKNATHAERRLLGALKVASIALWCDGCCFCFYREQARFNLFSMIVIAIVSAWGDNDDDDDEEEEEVKGIRGPTELAWFTAAWGCLCSTRTAKHQPNRCHA